MKEYYVVFSDRAASKRCIPGLFGARRCTDCYECPVSRCVVYPAGPTRVTVSDEVARRLARAARKKAKVVEIFPVEGGRVTKKDGCSIWL